MKTKRFDGKLFKTQVDALKYMRAQGAEPFTVMDIAEAIEARRSTVGAYMPTLLNEGIVEMTVPPMQGQYYTYAMAFGWQTTPLGRHIAQYL